LKDKIIQSPCGGYRASKPIFSSLDAKSFEKRWLIQRETLNLQFGNTIIAAYEEITIREFAAHADMLAFCILAG
jgi:hypothetical protein